MGTTPKVPPIHITAEHIAGDISKAICEQIQVFCKKCKKPADYERGLMPIDYKCKTPVFGEPARCGGTSFEHINWPTDEHKFYHWRDSKGKIDPNIPGALCTLANGDPRANGSRR